MKRHAHWLFIAAVVLVPAGLFGVVKWYEQGYTPLPVCGGKQHRVAGFHLTNQHDQPVSPSQWKDKIVVANFFFTHCPVVCPKMTRSLKNVQSLYRTDTTLLIASFSVDPARDSVAQLQHYAEAMNITGNWDLLTGDKKEIYRLARKSFLVTATDGDGGPQDFIHSELLILLDGQGRIRGFYNGTIQAEVDELVKAIERLKKQS